jgi:hypothetical protein
MSYQEKLAQLEAEKKKLELEAAWEKKQAFEKDCKELVGKCFKTRESGQLRQEDGLANNWLRYVQMQEYHGGDSFTVQQIAVAIGPNGLKIVKGKLALVSNINRVSFNLANRAKKRDLTIGKEHSYNHTRVKAVHQGIPEFEYDSSYYELCSEDEFYRAFELAIEASEIFFEKMSVLFDKKPLIDHDRVGILKQIQSTDLTKLTDLLKEVDKGVSLASLLHAGGKVGRYNYFNSNYELTELVQYDQHGGKGLNLDIQGGDGGTDYEPYTTHYYINQVRLDWLHILYPIRLALKSKVHEVAKELDSIPGIHEPGNWICNYDDSSYDATFYSAAMGKDLLQRVNVVIKKHLK